MSIVTGVFQIQDDVSHVASAQSEEHQICFSVCTCLSRYGLKGSCINDGCIVVSLNIDRHTKPRRSSNPCSIKLVIFLRIIFLRLLLWISRTSSSSWHMMLYIMDICSPSMLTSKVHTWTDELNWYGEHALPNWSENIFSCGAKHLIPVASVEAAPNIDQTRSLLLLYPNHFTMTRPIVHLHICSRKPWCRLHVAWGNSNSIIVQLWDDTFWSSVRVHNIY